MLKTPYLIRNVTLQRYNWEAAYRHGISSYPVDTQILVRRVGVIPHAPLAANYPVALLRPKQQPQSSGFYGSRACILGHERSRDRVGIVREINNRKADNIEISGTK